MATFLINNLPTIITAAVQIIVAVTEGMAEAMPELIPAVVEAVLTICEALVDNLPELILAAQQLFLGIVEGIILALPDILSGVVDLASQILESLAEIMVELPQRALEWGLDFINGFVEGITNALPNLINGVSNVASTIADYLHFSTPDKGDLADMDRHGGYGLIENFIDGMQNADGDLQRALLQQTAIINNGISAPDYTGALSGISSQLAGLGGGVPQVINVYVGSQKFATAVVNANATENYRTGGN